MVEVSTKIKILLDGDITQMPKKQVLEYFKDAFKWAEGTERYKLAARLRDKKSGMKMKLKKLYEYNTNFE